MLLSTFGTIAPATCGCTPRIVLTDVLRMHVKVWSAQPKFCAADVPLWARQMEVFILEDMNELEAARIVLGGLLESGQIRDADELRFLRRKLEELERRTGR